MLTGLYFFCKFDKIKNFFIHVHTETFDIPVSITITSNPMPMGSVYQAASSVTLTCEIDDTGTFAPLTYQWISTCLGDCFVRNQTSPVVSREGLRSIDAGSHTCTVTDDVGNRGSAQTVTITVMGKLIPNYCHSVKAHYISIYINHEL